MNFPDYITWFSLKFPKEFDYFQKIQDSPQSENIYSDYYQYLYSQEESDYYENGVFQKYLEPYFYSKKPNKMANRNYKGTRARVSQREDWSRDRYVQRRSQGKHSGAVMTRYYPKSGANKDKEQTIVNGWRLSRNKELIKITAVTTEKTSLSEKGWYSNVAVTFINTVTGAKYLHWGTMQKSTGKVVVSDMAFVMNPKAKNGGYAGTFVNND
ncbi:hypothetical protein SDC9_01504 [bioreactor metagenome]|uniref:Uncharacterized protein n=1 Tax=bioreactor metagenome TaxID=1076179 RepID=A0A644SQU7_9ZZZZ